MFSSHRPKVYRSRLGCCICSSKSSSSRFTSSEKYEDYFAGCFGLVEKRSGEVCNACVLLIKRWRKLPEGSTKNWNHIVDIRYKPNVRRNSMKKRVTRGGSTESENSDEFKMSPEKKDESVETEAYEIASVSERDLVSSSPSPVSSEVSELASPASITTEDGKTSQACQTSFLFPSVTSTSNKLPYIDLSTWRREEVCCGVIFRGPGGEVLVDPKLLNPFCNCSKSVPQPVASKPLLTSQPVEIQKTT